MGIPLFQYISENVTPEGTLPGNFSLPDEGQGNGLRFADGALDGIYIYHTQHAPLSPDELSRLGGLIALAASGRQSEAEEGFRTFTKEHHAITIIDDLQGYIADHQADLNPNEIYEFAVHMALETDDRECVKIGLSLLELLNIYGETELTEAVRTLGLSDEFTIFSVFLMRKWPDPEREILSLARKVRGWGRIHCIYFLEADLPETKEWLLINGVDNDVVPAYSAWEVYEKAEIDEFLKRNCFSPEEVHALLALTDALMDEGPVAGVSRMDSPKAFLERIITIAEAADALSEDDKDILERIKNGEIQE
ncbi:MAG: hypothetical protein J5824_05930 [Lachnospiraceae bacterium]|nr:hypothetical protein [Lachnospiraceae bacterium]